MQSANEKKYDIKTFIKKGILAGKYVYGNTYLIKNIDIIFDKSF